MASTSQLFHCTFKISHAFARRAVTLPLHSPPTAIRFSSNVPKNATTSSIFTWDDVLGISQPKYAPNDSSDLTNFFEKISLCNRGSEFHSDFVPFVIEDVNVGYIHKGFANHLRRFEDVFILSLDSCNGGSLSSQVMLHPSLRTPDDRTAAVAEVIKCLGEDVIPGIRNELYPVASSFGAPVFFSLERAAAPYFGIKAYGVHMNGYVERPGQKLLWVGKRSQEKPTYPGMLDHLVAGGLPHGISCGENLMKECEEEAGIPRSISIEARPVGAVSYSDINGYRYKRDILFCYDLKLPEDFMPLNQDGEVESFKLIPVPHVANIIRKEHFFKSNCYLVIIDFLFRHGYIGPECTGYLDLLQSLRRGN